MISDTIALPRNRRFSRLRKYIIFLSILLVSVSAFMIAILPTSMGSELILRHVPSSDILGFSNIEDIEISNHGIVYMASYEYVHRFSIWNDTFLEPLQFNSTPDSGLMGAIDIEILWGAWGTTILLGGNYPGCAVRYFEDGEIGNYTSDQFNITGTRFNHIASYQDGHKIFLGTDDRGLGIITQYNRTPYFINITHGLPHNQITNLKVRGNYLLIGTSGGFAIYDLVSGELTPWAQNDIGGRLQVIAIEYYHATQTVYIGNSDGLFIFRRNGDAFDLACPRINSQSETPLPRDEVYVLELDVDRNRIYVGSHGGLSYIDISDDTTVHPMAWGYGLEDVGIRAIRVPSFGGNLYLGTTLDYDSYDPGSLFEVPLDFDSQVSSAVSSSRAIGFVLMLLVPAPWGYEYWAKQRKPKRLTDQQLIDIIAQGETRTVEFKETLLFDVNEQEESDYKIPLSCFKTIAGFLNTCGGLLFIGVRDETREIVGLEPDFELLKSKIKRKIDPEDQFEQHFDKLRIKLCLDKEFWPLVVSEPRELESKTVYVVQVQQADEYVFLEKKDVFYIREKKETIPISPRKITEHLKRRNLYCSE